MSAHWAALLTDADCDNSLRIDPQGIAVWALQFTPRVTKTDHAVLLEVEQSLRLFGGEENVRQLVHTGAVELGVSRLAWAPTSLAALACARVGNLDGFWRKQFGYTHGVAIVTAFYEYVIGANGEKVVLEFKPDTGQSMYVACLWSHWTAPGKDDLYSFAFITDEPPAEVLAAGHDRCIIPLKQKDIDLWLDPDPNDLDSLYDILQGRERPFFEHRIAR